MLSVFLDNCYNNNIITIVISIDHSEFSSAVILLSMVEMHFHF